MGILGKSASAGVFTSREKAEEAWEILNDAGIPAVVITDPGIFGKYSVSVEVERPDLDKAIGILRSTLRPDIGSGGESS